MGSYYSEGEFIKNLKDFANKQKKEDKEKLLTIIEEYEHYNGFDIISNNRNK